MEQPGRHVAIDSLWITVASVLACYTIEPEHDENGKPMTPKAEWYSGPSLTSRLLPFQCRFVPRSKDVEASLGLSWGGCGELWANLYYMLFFLLWNQNPWWLRNMGRALNTFFANIPESICSISGSYGSDSLISFPTFAPSIWTAVPSGIFQYFVRLDLDLRSISWLGLSVFYIL